MEQVIGNFNIFILNKINILNRIGGIKVNNKIFDVTSNNLSSTLYGTDEDNNNKIFSIDSNGKLILSPLLTINVEASNLDIRNLNVTRDNAIITANDLDIRSLDGNQDSIQIYNKSYVEDFDSGTIVALGTRTFLTKDTSNYSKNIYLVRNTGGVAVTVTLQIAPSNTESYFVNSGSQFDLIVGGATIFNPSNTLKYARIKVSALLFGSVTVNYFGQS
ncbi:MAG: hypothetical protein APF81_21625 [Desulfosporosinus sp. BRH_c37]|nr:MAG: hypothetical protein APF81_21625 [Desulfosporosinus sp. BRH_c37]